MQEDQPLTLNVTLDADEGITDVSASGDPQEVRDYLRFVMRACLRQRAIARTHAAPARPRARNALADRRPRAQSTRSSAKSGDSGDDEGESSEPPSRRLCENKRCGADISHLDVRRDHCDNACKQQAYRDRRVVELLDEKVGTIVEGLSCTCEPDHNVVEQDHCLKCGYPRGKVTCAWVDERGAPARSFVTAPTPVAKLRTTTSNRKRAAKLRAENQRKRKTGEYRWDDPTAEAA